MANTKQLSIPGLEAPVKPPGKSAAGLEKRIAALEDRALSLEMELTLLRAQMEKEDKDHA